MRDFARRNKDHADGEMARGQGPPKDDWVSRRVKPGVKTRLSTLGTAW